MNFIKLLKLDQFESIICDSLNISGVQSSEIYHNMWCVSLEGDLAKNIKIEQIHYFIDRFIEDRKQQLKKMDYKKNVVFYAWFDKQALQLRFNVITGNARSLPFECKTNFVSSLKTILNNFICVVRYSNEFGDKIEFFDKSDENFWKDEDEQVYILDVFVQQLSIEQIEV